MKSLTHLSTNTLNNLSKPLIFLIILIYWRQEVLNISDGIDEYGVINWKVTLCLLLAWVLVYLCIFKGIRTTGKVSFYFDFIRNLSNQWDAILLSIHRFGVLISREKSVFFCFQSPKTNNQIPQNFLLIENSSDKLDPKRIFKDGRQTPD